MQPALLRWLSVAAVSGKGSHPHNGLSSVSNPNLPNLPNLIIFKGCDQKHLLDLNPKLPDVHRKVILGRSKKELRRSVPRRERMSTWSREWELQREHSDRQGMSRCHSLLSTEIYFYILRICIYIYIIVYVYIYIVTYVILYILSSNILYYIISYYITLHYIILCYIILYYITCIYIYDCIYIHSYIDYSVYIIF